jgi:nitrogen regulatory protein P-II 1
VFEGEGTGKYTDSEKDWLSFKFPQMHSKVIKLELVCRDEDVGNIIDIVHENGCTCKSEDGLIYISDVDEVVRIRDGQKGIETLHH